MKFRLSLSIAACLIASTTTLADKYQHKQNIKQISAQNQKTSRDIENLYMIVLKDESLAKYQESKNGSGIQSTVSGAVRLNVNSSSSQRYLSQLQKSKQVAHQSFSNRLGRSLVVLNDYQYAINGFTTRLSVSDVKALKLDDHVKRVIKITPRFIQTDTGPTHIKAPSVWDAEAVDVGTKGEGIIVGILDTGISPYHRSFSATGDDGYEHVNPLGSGNYLGDCAVAAYAKYCNNKLIGIWSHPDITTPDTPDGEDPVGIDYDGHGSHVAGTAAGNMLNDVPIYNVIGDQAEFEFDQISGVAPYANIVSYQICDKGGACYPDLTALAVEHAIANNIDVINYSVGGDPIDPWASVDALAFLSARAAGIHVAISAGNDGSDASTISSPANAPWVTSVAAVTHGRSFTGKTITFNGGNSTLAQMSGVAATSGVAGNIVYAGDFGDENCLTPFASNTFSGQIVVCVRNEIARVEKGRNVLAGGAGGMVLINDPAPESPDNVVADFHVLPTIHLTIAQGEALVDWLSSGTSHQATITASELINDPNRSDIVAGFSSRGPEIDYNQWLLPEVAAPGVEIYSALTGTDFGFLDGTSMASPHVAGAMALLSSVHPTWSPSQMQSALMLTANNDTYKVEDGSVIQANAFDSGSGTIQLDKAVNAGFVLSVESNAYNAADPFNGGNPSTLNIPALVNKDCRITCTWRRTLTGTGDSSWQVTSQDNTAGLTIEASPSSFTLSAGQTIDITFTATIGDGFVEQYGMGSVVFTPSNTELSAAAMPIIGEFIAGSFPAQVSLTADFDNDQVAIAGITTIGTDDFQARVFGLAELNEMSVTVPRDDSDSDSWPVNIYNDPQFTESQAIFVPAGTKLLKVDITSTDSPDLDLYIGIDLNSNGRLDTAAEALQAICQAATNLALESCFIESPASGNYFITIHNYGNFDAPSGANDNITYQWSIIGENDGGLSVVANPVAAADEEVELDLLWNGNFTKGQQYITAIELGTSAATPNNIGLMPVLLFRSDKYVKAGDLPSSVSAGNSFIVNLTLEANRLSTQKSVVINVEVPSGLTLSAVDPDATLSGNTLSWNIVQPASSDELSLSATLQVPSSAASSTTNIVLSYSDGGATVSQNLGQLTINAQQTGGGNNSSNGGSGGSSGGSFGWLLVLIALMRVRSVK